MTSESNKLASLARQWALEAQDAAKESEFTEDTYAAIEFVLANTKPETMADIAWDSDEHYLSGCATTFGSMVMLRPQGETILVHNLNTDLTEVFDREDLTPNGKRYELREVTEPEHPSEKDSVRQIADRFYAEIVGGDGDA